MPQLELYVCGVHENGKPHAACYARYAGKEIFSMHDSPPVEWRQGRGLGPLLSVTLWGAKEANRLGFQNITIHHAFEGVEAWVSRKWKANKVYTQKYREQMDELSRDLNIQFIRIHTRDTIYQQIQHICFVATGKAKSKREDFPFHVDPFQAAPPKDSLDSRHLCPRCMEAGELSQHVHLRHVNGVELVCPICHLHLPNHEKLSYDRWRDCTNPKCEASISLRARIILGDDHPNYALQCPFCFTTYPFQILTPYWARLWVEKSERSAVDLEGSILDEVMWLIKEKYEESKLP